MTPAPPSRPAGVMAGFTKVGGLRPPQSGGVVGAEVVAAWASRRPGLARAADLAGSAARPNEVDGAPTPGLRGTPVALRSEPGITSARTLRGSEDDIPSGRRRGGSEGTESRRQRRRCHTAEGDPGGSRGEGEAAQRTAAHPAGGEGARGREEGAKKAELSEYRSFLIL